MVRAGLSCWLLEPGVAQAADAYFAARALRDMRDSKSRGQRVGPEGFPCQTGRKPSRVMCTARVFRASMTHVFENRRQLLPGDLGGVVDARQPINK
ncbi:hypothetical protein NDU88_007062 [Pleurodeles waltl]|uniref:Secreted protein n=1 Tax=Pleurodeles waltl TaxID=8319 RepID=A0AAV7QMW2_PLEWA|nr:hypothetical protein NDU88_007062 [Pleurodeles waltl]